MVGNKREKKEKNKRKKCGYVVGREKKREKKEKKKKRKESPRVWREKKEIISQYFYNIFTINLKVGYY